MGHLFCGSRLFTHDGPRKFLILWTRYFGLHAEEPVLQEHAPSDELFTAAAPGDAQMMDDDDDPDMAAALAMSLAESAPPAQVRSISLQDHQNCTAESWKALYSMQQNVMRITPIRGVLLALHLASERADLHVAYLPRGCGCTFLCLKYRQVLHGCSIFVGHAECLLIWASWFLHA